MTKTQHEKLLDLGVPELPDGLTYRMYNYVSPIAGARVVCVQAVKKSPAWYNRNRVKVVEAVEVSESEMVRAYRTTNQALIAMARRLHKIVDRKYRAERLRKELAEF